MEQDKKRQDKISIYIVLVGLVFLIMKLTIPMSLGYPAYQIDNAVIPETQLYTLNQHYGAEATYYGSTYSELGDEAKSLVNSGAMLMNGVRWNTRVDLFSDFIGYALMTFGCLRLQKRRGTFFRMAYIAGICSIVMKALIGLAPYAINGLHLMWFAFFLGIATFFMKISISYFFVVGLCQCLDRVNYRQDRRVLLMIWLLMFIVQFIVAVTTFALVGSMTMVYNIILFFLTAFFIWKCVELAEYAVRSEPVPHYTLSQLYTNSEYHQKRLQVKRQREIRKTAGKELRERRRKIEEAKRR